MIILEINKTVDKNSKDIQSSKILIDILNEKILMKGILKR